MKMIENNSLSSHPTRFLMGPAVIAAAMKQYGVASENEAYPTGRLLTSEHRSYYGEIWSNGMDWNKVYWILFTVDDSVPVAVPLMIFDSLEQWKKIEDVDLRCLFNEALDTHAALGSDWEPSCAYWETAFVHPPEKVGRLKPLKKIMRRVTMKHPSMDSSQFLVLVDALPKELLRESDK